MNIKKVIAITLAVGVISAMGVVYAATTKTPAEITAGLTGKTVTELNAQRSGGKTYGAIAKDAGVLDEFKLQMLEQRKVALDQRVKDGTMTQAQADTILSNIKNNQTICDGTGSMRANGQSGGCTGSGDGASQGCGMGSGGLDRGNGSGFGRVR